MEQDDIQKLVDDGFNYYDLMFALNENKGVFSKNFLKNQAIFQYLAPKIGFLTPKFDTFHPGKVPKLKKKTQIFPFSCQNKFLQPLVTIIGNIDNSNCKQDKAK